MHSTLNLSRLKHLLAVLFVVSLSTAAFAQKEKSVPKAAPTPAAPAAVAEVFTSEKDLFSIGLPAKPSKETEIRAGESFGVLSGMKYAWKMKEGTAEVQHAVFDEPMRGERDFLDFAGAMKGNVLHMYNGKMEKENIDKTGNYRLSDVSLVSSEGKLIMYRWRVSNKDFYQVSILLKGNTAEDKELAAQVMDSFKITEPAGTLVPAK